MQPPRPIVAVVGRPNVGKSTLVNRIVGGRAAVVQETPGVTRDRRDFVAEWNGSRFSVIDTGGWAKSSSTGLVQDVSSQAEVAIASADVIVLVVDTHCRITSEDAEVAALLRPVGDRVLVAANKADNDTTAREAALFRRLGLGIPFPVSAIHGRGVADLLDTIVSRAPSPSDHETGEHLSALAIVGRPNVGKSTLLNQLVGEQRVLVSPIPGTTRDPIDVVVTLGGSQYRIVDTAGIRRRPKITEDADFFAVLRAQEALKQAEVSFLVVDAIDGVTQQDQRIAELAAHSGTGLIILLNKWDAVSAEEKEHTESSVAGRLGFAGWAPVLRISALNGARLQRLAPAVEMVLDNRSRHIPTPRLNRLVAAMVAEHPPPVRKGRRPKVLYAAQSRSAPPTIALFVKGGRLDPTYVRFVEGRLRQAHDFTGTPIRVVVRRGKRPERKG